MKRIVTHVISLMFIGALSASAQNSVETFKAIRLENDVEGSAIQVNPPSTLTPYSWTLPSSLTPGFWTFLLNGTDGTSTFVPTAGITGGQNQVPFFSSPSQLSGSRSFLFDSTTKQLSVTSNVANTPVLRLSKVGAGTGADTLMLLRSSNTGTGRRELLRIESSGLTDTAVGLAVSVTGATTNYAALFSGRVGIGTATPSTELDVNGAIAYRQRAATITTAGPYNNMDFGGNNDRSYVRVGGSMTVNSNWSGFTGGTDGKLLTITNATGNNMTFINNSSSSTAGNRILTVDGNNLVVTAGATLTLIYSQVDLAWRVTAISPLSITAFSSFTSNSVASGDILPASTTAYIKVIPTGNIGTVYLENGALIGQILVVHNYATGNSNQFKIGGTNIVMGSSSSTLTGGDAVFFVWDGAAWQLIARKGS